MSQDSGPRRVYKTGVAINGYVLAGTADSCADGLAVAATDVDGNALTEPTCTGAVFSGTADVAVSAEGGSTRLWVDDEVVIAAGGG